MTNWDTAIARRYWHQTFENMAEVHRGGLGEEGAPEEPLKFKIYRGLPWRPLPQRVAAALAAGPRSGGALSPEDLSTFLYHGYGLSRIDVGAVGGWPYHRSVASARCFYPTELYLWLPADADRPAGLHHYDQAHHRLVEVRAGIDLPTVAAAVHADFSGAAAVVVLTSHFWKTAFRYRHYAYRLCSQEAGLVVGNLLMVAEALGLGAEVRYQFLDEVLDRLLGLVEDHERSMAVVALYPEAEAPGTSRVLPGRQDAARLLAGIAPVLPEFLQPAAPARPELAGDTYECDRASVLRSTEEFAVARLPSPGTERASLRLPADPPADLAEGLHRRNSGGTLFRPTGEPLTAAQLGALIRGVVDPYRSDLGDAPLSRCLLVVQRVTDVEPGIYAVEGNGRLDHRGPLPPGRIDADMRLGPPAADYPSANVLAFIVADRGHALDRLGNRSYRILGQDSGVLAQRLCVNAGGLGLASRPINGYSTTQVQQLLGLNEPDEIPLWHIPIGWRPATGQYELPVIF